MITEYDLDHLASFDKREVKAILNRTRDHIIKHIEEQDEANGEVTMISPCQMRECLKRFTDVSIRQDLVAVCGRISA